MILAYASTIGKPDLEINHWIEEMEEAIHLVDKISLPPSETVSSIITKNELEGMSEKRIISQTKGCTHIYFQEGFVLLDSDWTPEQLLVMFVRIPVVCQMLHGTGSYGSGL